MKVIGTLLAAFPASVIGFQQSAFNRLQLPTNPAFLRKSTALGPVVQQDEPSPLSYSEKSRAFRRDFYTHESWIKHRSKERFVGTIIKIFESGVVRALVEELVIVGGVAFFVLVYNALLITGWEDFALVYHDPIMTSTAFPPMYLPLTGFTLSSSALSLLLVFKTDSSYQRWDEARKAWGVVVNNSRTILRESSAWIHKTNLSDDEKYALVRRVADAVWLFPRSLQRHLLQPAEDEEPYRKDILARVQDKRLAQELLVARHKPSLALFELSSAINAIPLDTVQRTTLEKAVSQLCEAVGGCDRIFTSPVPVLYTRFAARFVEIWMLSLPLGLYRPFEGTWNHWPLLPVSMLLGFFFLGIEELAIQLEEPFSVLPLAKISGGIGLSAEEHVQWMEKTMRKMGPTSEQTRNVISMTPNPAPLPPKFVSPFKASPSSPSSMPSQPSLMRAPKQPEPESILRHNEVDQRVLDFGERPKSIVKDKHSRRNKAKK